ncbi:hypothetical protein BB561_006872, partial [Smittium simulii]
MTIIKKQTRKKIIILPFEILELRAKLENGEESSIPELVQSAFDWPFLRGDFYHWVKVLDRFDAILERTIKELDLDNKEIYVSYNTIDNNTTTLICSILDFTRLLMENCVNRNLYSSFDRLIPLLRCIYTDILKSCLRLLLQMAQSGIFQQEVRHSIFTALPQLSVITESWLTQKIIDSIVDSSKDPKEQPHKKSSSTDVLSSTLSYNSNNSSLFSEAAFAQLSTPKNQKYSTSFTPIKRKNSTRQGSIKKKKTAVNTIPPQSLHAQEGLVTINIYLKDIKEMSCLEIFDQLKKLYCVPPRKHFDLLQRIRVALALSTSDEVDFNGLLKCRLYSTAVM